MSAPVSYMIQNVQPVNSGQDQTIDRIIDYLSVDTVTRDGHQVTFSSHDVTEQGQVTIVDVQTVELEHHVHFLLDGFSNSLDTEDRKDFANVVRVGTNGINVAFAQDPHQRRAVCFQKPLGDGFEFSGFSNDNPLLLVSLRQVHVHFTDRIDTLH